MNMLEANTHKVSDSLNSIVQLASEFGDASLKDIKLYTGLVQRICIVESTMNTHAKAIKEASREQTIESFNRRYDAAMDKRKSQVYGHKRYKDFVEFAKLILTEPSDNANEARDEENDDLIVENEGCEMIDSVTQRPIENPVRNLQCNHVYEKSAIEALLKQKSKIRCPWSGCTVEGFIQPKLLQVDVKLKQQLARNRANKL